MVRGHRPGDTSRASFNLSVSSAAITRIQCGPSHGIVTGVGKFFDAPMLFEFGGFSFTIPIPPALHNNVDERMIPHLLNDQFL
jgi:hypothetical protein